MTDVVIGGSGPLSRLLITWLKNHGKDTVIVNRNIVNGIKSIDFEVSNKLLTENFENLYFLLSSIKVNDSNWSMDEIYNLPEVRVARYILPLINAKRIIFFSSAGAIYGNKSDKIVKETDELNPVSAYGASKLVIEKLIEDDLFHNIEHKLTLRIANPFGIVDGSVFNYGLLPKIINNIRKNEPTTIYAPMEYKKDYFSVEILKKVINAIVNDKLQSGVYNIGSGESRSIKEICEEIEINLKLKPNIKISENPNVYDTNSGIICIRKINKVIDNLKSKTFQEELRDLKEKIYGEGEYEKNKN